MSFVINMINELTDIEGLTRHQVEQEIDNKFEEFLELRKYLMKKMTINEMNVHMDELINEKLLICRHKALLAVEIISFLVKEGILPQGTVRQYRSSVYDRNQKYRGIHTWAIYRKARTGALWICDPRWEIGSEITQKNSSFLSKKYGKSASS